MELNVELNSLCFYARESVSVSQLTRFNYISTENMRPNRGGVEAASSLPLAEQTRRYRRDDVLVSNIRPYFKKIWLADREGGCSNDVLVFRAKEGCHPGFLYYLLADDAFFDYATATAKGTKMPRGDQAAIMRYEVPAVSGEAQLRIAEVLSALDRKIQLNRRVGDNLERQAQAIFQSRFLNLQQLPAEWRRGNLLDIASYRNGLAMQRYRPSEGESGLPVLKIKELRQGVCGEDCELCSPRIKQEYIVHDGDVIFSWSGSLMLDIWCGGTCGLNQHLFKVTSADYDKWFYYLWTAHHLDRFTAIAADKATTMGHIKREDLAKSEVIIPSESDFAELSALFNPIFAHIEKSRVESRQLASLRDALLPRLLSGGLDVSGPRP